MLTIATTKEFLDRLFIESDKDEYHIDLFNFLKNEISNIKLICDFNSITEYRSALNDNPLWELLLDKNEEIKFNPNLDTDIEDGQFYNKLQEENIFLTSHSHQKSEELSKKYGYIYISSENISKCWEPIKFIRENSMFKVTNDRQIPANKRFDSWDCLDKYIIPITTILIFDKYILQDKSNQKLKDNLFKLLEKFCKNSLSKPLNLSIISEFSLDNDMIMAYDKIYKFFEEKAITNVKLNILRHDKSMYPKDFEGLHSRLILTNNLRIRSDDSFNFFKADGKVNNDVDIHFSLHMCNSVKCFYNKELKQIKRYVSKLENILPNSNLIQKVYFYNDKENYLFN